MNIERLYSIFLKSSGISTDTRKILPGSLFFALKGDKFDGNKFAAEALLKGSVYSVTDDKSLKGSDRFIYVKNVLETLQHLALYHRKKLKIPFIAITGSNGKTTTKELCYAILCKKYRTIATQGNLNNHIGVPLTVLSVRNQEIALIEMGANHEGEINFLCTIAEPEFGLITNIGLAHLEGFGSFEGIKRGKTELYNFIKKENGRVFYNHDNPILAELVKEKKIDANAFGNCPDSICYGSIIENSRFLKIKLHFSEKTETIVQTRLVGNYNLENIVASAAIGIYFGVAVDDIKSAIENYYPTNSRSQYLKTENNRVILDAYNANPSSMNYSILNFLSMEDEKEKLLILGDMLELGDFTSEEHLKIINLVQDSKTKNVYFVGKEFSKASINTDFKCFGKVEDLKEFLKKNRIKDHLVFLKGSRGMLLEQLLAVL
jgi:UDP-N-acetylmuramoyl-tripeptide--D-alanyl-D-alanine ligase